MYTINELKDRLLSDLKEIAERQNVGNFKRLSKQDLIYKILDQQALTPNGSPAPAAPDAAAAPAAAPEPAPAALAPPAPAAGPAGPARQRQARPPPGPQYRRTAVF